MTTKLRTTLLLFLSVLLLSTILALSYNHEDREDPEQRLQQCRQQCQQSRLGDQQRRQCERRCEEQYQQERQQQEERGGRGGESDGGGRGDPEERLHECKRDCRQQRHDQRQQRDCERRCEEQYQRERGRGGEDRDEPEQRLQQCRQQCQQSQQGEQQRRQCERRCEEQYQQERQQQEERGGRGRGEDRDEPEQRLQQCRQQCQQSRQGEQQRRQCEHRCEEQYQQEKQQQEERGGRGGERDGGGRGDPEERLHECKRDCRQERHDQRQQRECERRCEEQYQQERGRGGEVLINPRREEGEEQEGEGRKGNNPYVFEEESFRHFVRTEHGRFRVLRRFSERSDLLLGIENYRFGIVEMNPQTLSLPKHCDAEAVFYVGKGRGIVTLVRGENRESHEIREGDIFRVPAGTTEYVINKDNNQKLCIAKLIIPISTPGRFQSFYALGGQNPESFFRSFSKQVLEAAFNVPSDRLERVFGQQNKGAIIKASEEQIRAMSRHSSSEGGRWPFGESSSSGPFNLLKKRPSHSNQHGQYYEADVNDYQQLRDLDIEAAFANISAGSMLAPYYNSKQTKIVLVVGGKGYFEMACPHLSSQGQREREGEEERGQGQEQGPHYQKVRARLSHGTVYVIPAGHPAVAVASRDENLQLMSFGINARDNQKYFLAGRNNILNKLDREAKELSLNVPAKEVEELFNAQSESVFLPGPEQRQEGRGRGEGQYKPLESILDFAGF